MNFSLEDNKGLTFVEMLVVVAITSLVMGSLIMSVLYFYRTNSHIIEQSYAISEGRKGIENMVRDIREAVYSETGGYPIESIDHNSIIFYSDVDRDKEVERIRYFIEDTKLKRATINPTGDPLSYSTSDEEISIVSQDVRNVENGVSTFVYFNREGDQMTSGEFNRVVDVAFVRVNLIVNVDPYANRQKFKIRSSATLRNVE